ncbi:MAG: hypothetical protein R6U96_18435 [Promethearchaeia archaeon]
MSEAKIPIEFKLFGVGELKGVFLRHLSPICADALLRKMPFVLRGRFHFGSKDFWILPGLGIKKGVNQKAKKDTEKGDIFYNPKSDELIIILEAKQMQNKMNKLGEITSNLDILKEARNGLSMKISKKEVK